MKNKKKSLIFNNGKNYKLIKELETEGITNKKILSAIKKIPRELFVEKDSIIDAYKNRALFFKYIHQFNYSSIKLNICLYYAYFCSFFLAKAKEINYVTFETDWPVDK